MRVLAGIGIGMMLLKKIWEVISYTGFRNYVETIQANTCDCLSFTKNEVLK